MRRYARILLAGLLPLLILCPGPSAAQDKEPIKISTAWLPGFDAFPIWLAKQRGWDAEEGLDVDMLYYSSGRAQVEGLAAGEWSIGGADGLTMVLAALQQKAVMVALSADESRANIVFAKPDDLNLVERGYNKDAPAVYGHPDQTAGRSVLVTTHAPPHYALSAWLKVLGLKDSDMVIKPVEPANLLDAFDAGQGDLAVFRTPWSFLAEERGWEPLANIEECGRRLADVIVADKTFTAKQPKTVSTFLRVWFRVIHMLAEEGPNEEIVDEYIRYYQEWAGMDLSLDMAEMDLKIHAVWPLDKQVKMFAGKAEAVKWQEDLAAVMADAGLLTLEELNSVKSARYVDGRFLRKVGKVPGYKAEESN